MLPRLPAVMHLSPSSFLSSPTPCPSPALSASLSLYLSLTHTNTHTLTELWVSSSCGDNVCAVLWRWRQQPVCKKRKWCCKPPRSRVPGRNVYPVNCLWCFTVNHFLHTVYERSGSRLRHRGLRWWHWLRFHDSFAQEYSDICNILTKYKLRFAGVFFYTVNPNGQ